MKMKKIRAVATPDRLVLSTLFSLMSNETLSK